MEIARRVVEDQRALAEVVEHQRREDDEEPGAADRRAAEVAHVGVERLGAGDRQHDGAERDERDARVVGEEVDARRSGRAPAGSPGRSTSSRDAGGGERRRTRRPSPGRTAGRRRRCRSAGSRTGRRGSTSVIGSTRSLQARRGDLDALDRRQHRDRRRDHAVAVEQRGAEEAERDQRRLRAAAAERRSRGSGAIEGHDAALAVVVGAHDEGHVLDRDDDRHRPEDQRDDAVDVAGRSASRRRRRRRRPSAARRAGWCRCRRRRRRARRARARPPRRRAAALGAVVVGHRGRPYAAPRLSGRRAPGRRARRRARSRP